MLWLLIACFVIMLASLSGKVLVWRSAGAFIERNLHLMVSFAVGVFLIFALQLSREVFEHLPTIVAFLWIAGGAIAITILCQFLPHGHDAHEHDADHNHEHEHVDAHRMLISDAIHNAGDGILLAASFVAGPVFGFTAALGVFIHEIVQETAEFFVLRDAGYSVRRALLLNFATASTVLIGAVGGYILLGFFETIEAQLLAIAAGGVFSVIFFDLLPHSIRDARAQSSVTKHIAWFIAGCMLMYGVTVVVPHQEHGHEEAHAYVTTQLS